MSPCVRSSDVSNKLEWTIAKQCEWMNTHNEHSFVLCHSVRVLVNDNNRQPSLSTLPSESNRWAKRHARDLQDISLVAALLCCCCCCRCWCCCFKFNSTLLNYRHQKRDRDSLWVLNIVSLLRTGELSLSSMCVLWLHNKLTDKWISWFELERMVKLG